jgi:serine protease Do
MGGLAGLPDLVPLVKELKPVVVNISTTQSQQMRPTQRMPPQTPFEDHPLEQFFRKFFDELPDRAPSRSLGSGVLVDADGHILTNNHVIEDHAEITVRLSDDREFQAQVVGQDAKTDLALIRIRPDKPLPVAHMGNSNEAEVGSWVVAIGNPFGLEATVTVGIISAKERNIGSGPYDNFIQTDAAINPGNSGGPLFNLKGEVIGINTAIFSRTGGNMGIGFSIPINMAQKVMAQLKDRGHVTRGWLGVRIQTVTKELVTPLGLPKQTGALVASVEPKSPAATSGVKSGDVILSFDGKAVQRMNDLPSIVAETPIGKQVDMEVMRNGKRQFLKVGIGEMADEGPPSVAQPAHPPTPNTPLGMTVVPLTRAYRERMELADDLEGVMVANIKPGSETWKAGVRPGDVITRIHQTPIADMADFHKAVDALRPGQSYLLLIQRNGEPLFLALRLGEESRF